MSKQDGGGMASMASPGAAAVSMREVEEWLADHLARLLMIGRDQLDLRQPFAELGLDSLSAVTLSGDLEHWLGRKLSPTLAWDYPTIEALARHLAADDRA